VDAGRPPLVTYVDTSALARLIFGEGDLTTVRRALQEGPVSSELTVVETRAALWKRRHDNDVDESERDELLSVADSLLFSAISMLSLNSKVMAEASTIVARFPVRTLDALHLATAAIAFRQARRHGRVMRFCTADRRQSRAAEELFGSERVLLVPPSC
jgi:predicted nucleic acid-binding protein